MLSQLLKPMPSLRPLPLPTMEAGDVADTMARDPPRLSPTTDGVDTMARDPPRLSPTTDGVDTTARDPLRLSPIMEATMVAITARGPLKLSPTMEAGATEDIMASDLLMLKPTTMGAMAHMHMASNCIMTLIHSNHPLVKELNRIKI